MSSLLPSSQSSPLSSSSSSLLQLSIVISASPFIQLINYKVQVSGVNISTHPEAGHAYNLEVGGSLSVPSGSIVCVFVYEFVFVLVFTFLFVFVLVNVFAIAAIGTCQILIGGLCLPKGYPPHR